MRLNEAFNKWIVTGEPFIIAKCGMSLDGYLTRPPGETRWLTSESSRTHAHQLRAFVDAMANNKFREQYTDALGVYLRDQEVAGLDICTDGDCRFDQDIGGQSWTSYPPHHMDGFDATHPKLAAVGAGGR